MLLAALREQVLAANLETVRRGLVLYTFGNVSGIARHEGLVAIKPSGVPYETMTAEQIVVCDLDGRIVEGGLRPSSDLATHLELYKHFPTIGGVAHTHSEHGSAWAQAQKPIPCFGTTHADYFHGADPVTPPMSAEEIAGDYEQETGLVICRMFAQSRIDPAAVPGVLVAGHAPFTWGPDAAAAAYNAVILEYCARLATSTLIANPEAQPISRALHDKHFLRKHGPKAYYGQSHSEPSHSEPSKPA